MVRMPKLWPAVFVFGLLFALATPALASDTKGTIHSVNADKSKFVMTDENGVDWTFKAGDNIQVRINDKAMALKDLHEGDQVRITYAKSGRDLIASEVTVKRTGDTTDTATRGTLKTINTDNNSFVITDKNDREWTFFMADGAKVKLNDKSKHLSDLHPGEKVHVTYIKKGNDLWATNIQVEKEGKEDSDRK